LRRKRWARLGGSIGHDAAALATSGRRKAESLMTANRLLLTAIAALALAGAAHAQETDSDVAGTAEQGF
jgi:hypothetical protein